MDRPANRIGSAWLRDPKQCGNLLCVNRNDLFEAKDTIELSITSEDLDTRVHDMAQYRIDMCARELHTLFGVCSSAVGLHQALGDWNTG